MEKKSQFARQTPDQAGLRKLPGLFSSPSRGQGISASADDGRNRRDDKASETVEGAPVASVSVATREPRLLVPPRPPAPPPRLLRPSTPESDVLREDDVLWYAGNAQAIASVRKIPGLAPIESADQVDKLKGVSSQSRRLIQAVVAKTGPLVGRSIRDMKFRSRYNAVVLAVHREGARVHARVGDVVLHPGDVLLLDAGPDFKREAAHSGSGFALVSVLEDSAPPSLGAGVGHRGGDDRDVHERRDGASGRGHLRGGVHDRVRGSDRTGGAGRDQVGRDRDHRRRVRDEQGAAERGRRGDRGGETRAGGGGERDGTRGALDRGVLRDVRDIQRRHEQRGGGADVSDRRGRGEREGRRCRA